MVNLRFLPCCGKLETAGSRPENGFEMNDLPQTGQHSRPEQRHQMKVLLLASAVFFAALGGCATAQEQSRTVERTIKSVPNRDTQIGVYLNVQPDCTSGPLPTIRLVSPPASGKVVVKNAKVKATNYKACLALEVPAYVAFYKSAADFFGNDVLTIEVKYAGGRTKIQKITVNVVSAGAVQKI
jgi:hypothetical protein